VTALCPTLQAFFTERLATQRHASRHTIGAYRDCFRLLLEFAQQHSGRTPTNLDIADLDATLISAFLDHLEHQRRNTVATRNARLAAIHSLFRFAALRHPEHAQVIQQVLAIPPKRHDRSEVSFLTPAEVNALLAAPDRRRWVGRRDHAMLLTFIQTGLRLSELTALRHADIELGAGAHLRCIGKGRKERATPLTAQTVSVLRAWLTEQQGRPDQPLFPTRSGRPLSPDAVSLAVTRHVASARTTCPSLRHKHVTPHVLRHTAAMRLLAAGVDIATIALWLGHERAETTMVYVHADMAIKERALARTAPTATTARRYRPPDKLLAFLAQL
jgi:site-specific recombinase XerD